MACKSCWAGSWSGPASNCTACELGRYSSVVEATSVDVCTICDVGKIATKLNGSASCELCPADTYLSNLGTDAALHDEDSDCSECPEGKFSQSDRSACIECGPGQYVFEGLACQDCPQGTYAPVAQETACLDCVAGFYTGIHIGASSCVACNAGQYSSGNAVNCTECAVGKTSGSRASSCTACPAGFYSANSGSDLCSACAAGYYSNSSASAECFACTKGRAQSATGQSSCEACEGGKYVDYVGASSCVRCSEDSENYGHEYSSYEGAIRCDKCTAGYYLSKNDKCIECPRGTDCSGEGMTITSLEVEPKYYRFTESSEHIYSCTYPRNCLGGIIGGNTSMCRKGAHGALCSLCEDEYYLRYAAGMCVHCGSSYEFYTAFSVIGLTILIGVGLYLFYRERKRSRSETLGWGGDEDAGADEGAGRTGAPARNRPRSTSTTKTLRHIGSAKRISNRRDGEEKVSQGTGLRVRDCHVAATPTPITTGDHLRPPTAYHPTN